MKPRKGKHVVKVVVWNHDNFGAFKSKEISKPILFYWCYSFAKVVKEMKSSLGP